MGEARVPRRRGQQSGGRRAAAHFIGHDAPELHRGSTTRHSRRPASSQLSQAESASRPHSQQPTRTPPLLSSLSSPLLGQLTARPPGRGRQPSPLPPPPGVASGESSASASHESLARLNPCFWREHSLGQLRLLFLSSSDPLSRAPSPCERACRETRGAASPRERQLTQVLSRQFSSG